MKNKAKHTAGKWYNEHGSIMTKINGEKLQIAIMARTQFCGQLNEKEQKIKKMLKDSEEADLRLLVSAPDLLSACEQALKALLPHFDDDNDGSDEANASNALLKAVEKAKGK